MENKAGNGLLQTFSQERQPVGTGVIQRANQGLRDHSGWMEAIGLVEIDVEKRKAALAEFDDPGELGRKRREAFQQGIKHTASEFHGLGIEMNQLCQSSAVYIADETKPREEPADPVKSHIITTYPGSRLPHAWINTRIPGERLSTIDLAGHGRFCLITGPGGDEWKQAARTLREKLNVPIIAYSIGWKQDYEDVYFDWASRREIQENGCVLVRPDRFVAWRSNSLVPDSHAALEKVVKSVLCLE